MSYAVNRWTILVLGTVHDGFWGVPSTDEDSHGEIKADKKGPMPEKGKADGKRQDLEDSIGEEQE